MPMAPWFRSAACAAVLAACSGPDTQFQQLDPGIAVSPPELAFGDAAVPLTHELPLFVQNAGKADLDVALSFDPELPEFDIAGDRVFLLEPDDERPVTVRFHPETFLPFATELVVASNDPTQPEIRVPVSGRGVYEPQPDIAAPPFLDLGTQTAGGSTTGFALVANEGEAPLVISEARLEGDAAFTLLDDPSGDTVGPGAQLPVVVVYAPLDEGGDQATLTLVSNDPDEPETEIVLLGNGGAGFQLPVAVIDCPSEAAPPEYVTLDGSASYDPGGNGISTYTWTLVQRPDGSQASFTSPVGPLVQLFADTAGTYEVGLTVTNGLTIPSAMATCVFQAIPADALHIELTWDAPSSDLDLHLRQNGVALFDSPDDACWCNNVPSWGSAGTDDDPRLDLDDLAGFGPENMNILLPADGVYRVAVHYYDDDYDGPVTATVRVYVYGALVSELQALLDEFDVWEVGTVDWPSGAFTADGTMDYSERRGCF
jgi:hypothetical protein